MAFFSCLADSVAFSAASCAWLTLRSAWRSLELSSGLGLGSHLHDLELRHLRVLPALHAGVGGQGQGVHLFLLGLQRRPGALGSNIL